MEWYLTVSHPHIILHVEHTDDVRPSDVGVSIDNVSPPSPADTDNQQCLHMIAVIMDSLMGLVNPDVKVCTGLSRAAHIARGRPI